MPKWLQSGRRRDVCVLLAAEGECNAQHLKARLESHYDERIDPKSFYGSLSALVDAGFVEKRTEGIHDVYALTPPGETRLRAHASWLQEALQGADDG